MDITEPLLKAFLLCEMVIVDKEDRFSIINNFNTLSTNKLPLEFAFKLYLSIMMPEGLHQIKITMIKPDRQETQVAQREFPAEQSGKLDAIIDVKLTSIDISGAYLFNAFVDGKQIGCDELTVVLLETE